MGRSRKFRARTATLAPAVGMLQNARARESGDLLKWEQLRACLTREE